MSKTVKTVFCELPSEIHRQPETNFADGPGEPRSLIGPLVLRLDIKVAKDVTKQLVIDRKIEDPYTKAD